MKVLIIGADGFIGSNLADALKKNHEVLRCGREFGEGKEGYWLDLLEKDSITKVLKSSKPDIIINAAGVVENNELAEMNVTFTTNLLESVLDSGIKPSKIIILGSAAEYGVVTTHELPVSEATPLRATNLYGQSKVREEHVALEFRQKHGLPVVIARIFNPIGTGMHDKFLVSRVLKQISEVKRSERTEIEITRLDAQRDYIVISDLTAGIKAIIEGEPKESTYNIGSGRAVTNGDLVNLIIGATSPNQVIPVVQTQDEPEPLFAIQADITRMKRDFNWVPVKKIEETIKEIIDASTQD